MAATTTDGATSPFSLWFAFLAAPLAWFGQVLGGYFLFALHCTFGFAGDLGPILGMDGIQFLYVILIVITALLATAGLVTAFTMWRRNRRAEENVVYPVGRRNAFVGLGATLMSGLMLLAILFGALPPFFITGCGRVMRAAGGG